MGDRVAVMRKGELQQVAPPQELYDRPVNLFVGGFIGSPSMNMLEATVSRRNGSYSLDLGGSRRSRSAPRTCREHPALAALRRPAGDPRDPAGVARGGEPRRATRRPDAVSRGGSSCARRSARS